MNLVQILSEQVRARPQAAAIIESRRGVDSITTFSELDLRSRRIAALLRDAGLVAGDSVLIFHPISADLYAALLGVFRLGAVAMFLDPSSGLGHIERCCDLQPPKALLASPKAHCLRLASPALRRIPLKFVFGAWLPGAVPLNHAQRFDPMEGGELCTPEVPALLTFTSGSTGTPRAAVRTHGFLLAQHQVLERHFRLLPGEVDLPTLPIFLLANLASGLTSVIPDADLRAPGAVTPLPLLAQIERHRITRTAASPAFLECLLSAGPSGGRALRGMRKIFTGGAPVFARLLDRLCQAAPDAEVEAVYGSTEAEPIAHLNARKLTLEDRYRMSGGHGLLAGQPIPEVRLRVIPDQWGAPLRTLSEAEFAAMELQANEPGEIVVAGDHVLQGYLHRQGDDETKIPVAGQVWHRTGDAGKLDTAGRLWLLGRCAEKVRDARGVLYPFAVECVAMEHEQIRRAAFLIHRGRRLLLIEPRDDFDETSRRALAANLEWVALDDLRILTRLPVDKRHNAKIDYPALRRMLG